MPVFAVRSVDGWLGIVAARNKLDAVEPLDELANFEGCPIRELPELMLLLGMDEVAARERRGALASQLGDQPPDEFALFGVEVLGHRMGR
jgi:hypothetical protein